MSTVKSLYHIVINTKNREMTIPEENKRQAYAYIYGVLRNRRCKLLRMNGIPNHIHLLVSMPAEESLSDLLREVKRSSSIWMQSHPEMFPRFHGWGKGYYAFSCGVREVAAIVDYIKGQESHHGVQSYDDEMKVMAIDNQCDYYEYD